MESDPYAGLDTRTRLHGTQLSLSRYEAATRRILVCIALATLAIGMSHLTGDSRNSPLPGLKASADYKWLLP